jgi:hypothetical protein
VRPTPAATQLVTRSNTCLASATDCPRDSHSSSRRRAPNFDHATQVEKLPAFAVGPSWGFRVGAIRVERRVLGNDSRECGDRKRVHPGDYEVRGVVSSIAHRPVIVSADEKLTAFLELEAGIRVGGDLN